MESTISIDRAGRLVVPKRLRKQLGLKAGSQIRVWADGGLLLMEPIREEPLLLEDGDLLLCGGYITGDAPNVDDLRAERIDALVHDAIR